MQTIKGLIIKDLLQLKSYKKTLIIYIIIFMVTGIAQEQTKNILVAMMTLGLGMFSIATFGYDEMAKADKYILSLPIIKREVVLAKYVITITATIIGAVIGLIASIVISLVMQTGLPDIKELMELVIASIFGIGMVEAIQIPCIYKYGAEKGRIQIFIAITVIAFLVGGIVWLGEKYGINLMEMPVIFTLAKFLPILLIVLTAIIYFISYKIAYGIYRKKEII